MSADVLIVGAGPAGAVAAIVLARAGVRVRLIDRETFPRHKLCGDTLNPGALAILRRLGLAASLEPHALRLDGMIVTGIRGAGVVGAYAPPHCGLSIRRIDLDDQLLREAIRADVVFEDGVTVVGALPPSGGRAPGVRGVRVRLKSGAHAELTAPITIAADGRRSALAFGLGLARHPDKPRRFAIGAYFEGVGGAAFRRKELFGEMHVRGSHYIGVAPVPGGLTNVCLVVPQARLHEAAGDGLALLNEMIRAEPMLADRFANARIVEGPVVLGPLAVDVTTPGVRGLLLAGDAAGFIDPMTGDGLRFAIRGGELAAEVACSALEHGLDGSPERLASLRRREFGRKWIFNRGLRRLAGSRAAIGALSSTADTCGAMLRGMIRFAGDVPAS